MTITSYRVNKEASEDDVEKKAGGLRRAIPQFLASTAQNFILFDNGLVLSYPTILVAALLLKPGETFKENEPFSLTESEASWYVSISYICQPLGSSLSGLFMEPLGRKKSMLLLNIPFFTAWTLLYFAPYKFLLFIASAIMGLSVGCTEAPILTYMGEISEARVRGPLTSYAQLCGQFAFVALYYTSAALKSWRYTAATCAAIPIITVVLVSLVPESPWWLVAKGRVSDAEAALCWLRGWVQPSEVKEELEGLIRYHEANKRTNYQTGSNGKLPVSSTEELLKDKKETLRDKLAYFSTGRILRPFTVICCFFFFYYGSGLAIFRPYLSTVFEKMGMHINTDDGYLMISIVGFIGNAVCMAAISYVGKRVLSISGLFGCAVCTLCLALVTFHSISDPIYGLYFLYALSFFTCLGVAPIPWMLQCELYPFKGRGMAAGVAAAVSYIIGFFGTKTFLASMSLISLQGLYIVYTVISIVGVVYLYIYLPETEGKTLEEVEEFFATKRKTTTF